MTNRVIEIDDTGAYLHATNSLLEIRIKENVLASMPFEEVGVLLLSNPAAAITQAAIAGIIKAGGMVVICGKNCLPEGLFLPVAANTSAARNYEVQAQALLPVKKRIWKELITAKIRFQAELLEMICSDDGGLRMLALKVKSGDPENVEAQAAQRYWHLIFLDEEFRRKRNLSDQNRFLNYGYTIIRACAARAICSTGLHPSFGIHHHNQYNPFRLADDIMEPFRPLVDRKVVEIIREYGEEAEMTKEIKKKLFEILTDTIELEGEHTNLFQAFTRCAASILHVFEKQTEKIILPKKLFIT